LGVSRPGARGRQRSARRPHGKTTPPPHAALVSALDRLLDPLETLQQEDFRNEPVRAGPATAAAELSRPSGFERLLWSARVRAARVRYSRRSPYRQIRSPLLWLSVLIGVLAIAFAWLVFGNGP
jgi:hypothetical protein